MLLNSFLESQRTSRAALSTIQHYYSDTPPPSVAEIVRAATADDRPGRDAAVVGTRRPHIRMGGRRQYGAVRANHDLELLKTLCCLTREEFDAIGDLSRGRV